MNLSSLEFFILIIDGRLLLQKKPETYLLNLFSGKSGLARRWQSCFEFHWQIIAGCGPLVKKKHKLRYNFNGLDTRYGGSQCWMFSARHLFCSNI